MTVALPSSMRALVLTDAGLTLTERPLPVPRRGEVLIRMHASPINPNDLLFLANSYEVKKPYPVVAGFEGSGTVVASGGGLMARFLVGRRVACAAGDGDGMWADFACTEAMKCAPVGKRVSTEQAATMLTNPLTAWVLLAGARRDGHRAFVQNAAAGALGRMLVRLCARFGLPLVNIVRRDDQVAALRALGAEHVLSSAMPGFEVELAKRCKHLGVRFGFDAIAGRATGQMLAALGDRGRVRVYGLLSNEPCQVDTHALVFGSKVVEGFTLYEWLRRTSMLGKLRTLMAVQRHLATELSTEVRARKPLADHAEALALARTQASDGKVLLMPGDVT